MNQAMRIKQLGVLVVFGASVLRAGAQEVVEPYHTPQERRDIADRVLNGMSIGSLMEVEGSIGNESGEDVSDIVSATIQLNLKAAMQEWISGRASLLWEEDDTEPFDLDEGVIEFGTAEVPWSLEVGKMYVPFGAFHSHFISDPLTIELGETRQSAALFGYKSDILKVQAGAFNGSVNNDTDDRVNEFVAAIALTPVDGIAVGAYWISNLGESDGLIEGISETIDKRGESSGEPYRRRGGAGGYLHAEVGPLIIEAEYMTALDRFGAGFLGETGMQPQAWNVELAFTVTDTLELAAKLEGSDEFPDMPKAQYGIAASYALFEKVALGIEYLHGSYDGDVDDRDIVTCQVAVEL